MNIHQMSNRFLIKIILENQEYIDFPEKEFVEELNESDSLDNYIIAGTILLKKIKESKIIVNYPDVHKKINYELFNNEFNKKNKE